jgi:AcrR family transcriptional regulator
VSSSAALVEPVDLPWREQKKLRTRQALHAAARRQVLESGLSAVTVEDICAEAGVSPRTFFNYFPSKAASALGLPDLLIDDDQRSRFLAPPSANLVRDLCYLIADVMNGAGDRLSDRQAMKDLVRRRPELKPELFSWLEGMRRLFLEVMEERTTPRRARRALALALASVTEALDEHEDGDAELGDRLWAGVAEMCAMAAVEAPR